jgi:catechol-2,3-dioxygenase
MIIGAVTIDSRNSEELSDFYQKLLGWEKMHHSEDGSDFIAVYGKEGQGPLLVFQDDPDYEPPVWPSETGRQQTMVHLDLFMTWDEYDDAIRHAISCGAAPAQVQFSDKWKVMLDPAGHPFCIDPVLPNKT